MSKCSSVTWGRLEQAKVRCVLEEGHGLEHTDGCLTWNTKPFCSGCGDGTGVVVDAENHASNCKVCNISYKDLAEKVQKLEYELSLQKTLARTAGVGALLGHNCPPAGSGPAVEARTGFGAVSPEMSPTAGGSGALGPALEAPSLLAAEWKEAALMFRTSLEKEKEVSATSHKLGYATAIVDVVGWLRNDRPCRPCNPEDPTASLCVACDEGQKGCLNDILDEAALKIEAARPGSLALVEAALYDRRDAVVALRNIAAILDGDGGHRQDGDASFAATVERIHLLVCDMREALRYAERAPLIIAEAATEIDDATNRSDTEDLDEIRDYAGQLAKMLAKVALVKESAR